MIAVASRLVTDRIIARRTAYLAFLCDGDAPYARAHRGETFLTPAGLVDWTLTHYRGDLSQSDAELAVGGAA